MQIKEAAVTTRAPFETQFEQITPKRAEEMLATNSEKNRRLGERAVERWAKDMRDGLWGTTHQGIAFDEQGRLIDGQHRLAAIVRTETTQTMMVSYGVPSDVFQILDAGTLRRARQFIEGSHAGYKEAFVKNALRLEELGGIITPSAIHNKNFSNQAIMTWLENNPDSMDYIEQYASLASRAARHILSSTPSALLFGGYLVGPHKWDRWWEDVESLTNGTGVGPENPLGALYRAGGTDHNRSGQNLARAVAVAVRYRDNRPTKMIRSNMYQRVQVW